MRLLVTTRADDSIKELCDVTHPILREYAERCGADFSTLSHDPPFMTDDDHPHFRILKVKELLEDYDRVLVLDSDMVIMPNCPNLFEVVPYDKIGSIYEDKGSRQLARRRTIGEVQMFFHDIGWRQDYINTGTFLVSQIHEEIFDPYQGKYWTGWGSDDVHFGFQLNRLGMEVHELPFQYNHMSMFSEAWNYQADPLDSYIIHFAGKPMPQRLESIKAVLRRIR